MGTNYSGLVAFAEKIGIKTIAYVEKDSSEDSSFSGISTKETSLLELKRHGYFV